MFMTDFERNLSEGLPLYLQLPREASKFKWACAHFAQASLVPWKSIQLNDILFEIYFFSVCATFFFYSIIRQLLCRSLPRNIILYLSKANFVYYSNILLKFKLYTVSYAIFGVYCLVYKTVKIVFKQFYFTKIRISIIIYRKCKRTENYLKNNI